MDLIRFQFRPQAECEMRCAQSQDLRADGRINLTGLQPFVLFFFPVTASLPILVAAIKKTTRLQTVGIRTPATRCIRSREIPVS